MFLKEFKEFITKGNIMDLAIGIIIGGAFQSIVNSLVNDIIMPVISIFTGKINFNNLVVNIGSASIKYGQFITNIVTFLIVGLSIFFMIKYLNRLNRHFEKLKKLEDLNNFNKKLANNRFLKNLNINLEENKSKIDEPSTKLCPYCFSEIHINATRCPNCTSEQPISKIDE